MIEDSNIVQITNILSDKVF